MRLTLRTLLAWLDDTLPPKDVARIGRQLHRSKFAQDLSRRIRRVVRQRRLTVPGMGTNTPIDSNIIAAYLDNSLPGDQTAAVESLALNSDVHLAEIAASHQILSLLEQPIQTGTDTYSKMYRLVKGPEARIQSDRWLQQTRDQDIINQATLLIEEERINFDMLELPLKSGFSRHRTKFMAGILIFGVVMLGLSEWLDINSGPRLALNSNSPVSKVQDQNLEFEEADLNTTETAALQASDKSLESTDVAKTSDVMEQTESSAANLAEKKLVIEPIAVVENVDVIPSSAIDLPNQIEAVFPGFNDLIPKSKSSIILVNESDPSLVDNSSEKVAERSKNWKKLTPNDSITKGFVRFASAEATRFVLPAIDIEIQSGSLLEWNTAGLPVFHQGQMKLYSKIGCSIAIRIDEKNEIRLLIAPDSSLVLSRTMDITKLSRFNEPLANSSVYLVMEKGSTDFTCQGKQYQSTKTKAVSLAYNEASNGIIVNELTPIPNIEWPKEAVSAKMTTELMNRYINNNRPLPVGIMDAISDKSKAVRDLALNIALWIDRDDIIVNSLTDLGNSELRNSAIESVRKAIQLRTGTASRISTKLAQELELDLDSSRILNQLLVTPETNNELSWKKILVDNLENPTLLIRQLSIEHLMKIAARDDMGYKAENPTKKGVSAWQSWLGMDGARN